jgi:hypothetical protein
VTDGEAARKRWYEDAPLTGLHWMFIPRTVGVRTTLWGAAVTVAAEPPPPPPHAVSIPKASVARVVSGRVKRGGRNIRENLLRVCACF